VKLSGRTGRGWPSVFRVLRLASIEKKKLQTRNAPKGKRKRKPRTKGVLSVRGAASVLGKARKGNARGGKKGEDVKKENRDSSRSPSPSLKGVEGVARIESEVKKTPMPRTLLGVPLFFLSTSKHPEKGQVKKQRRRGEKG